MPKVTDLKSQLQRAAAAYQRAIAAAQGALSKEGLTGGPPPVKLPDKAQKA